MMEKVAILVYRGGCDMTFLDMDSCRSAAAHPRVSV
jgi:hypothetical protein